MALVNTPGRFTASFAVKGLGSSKATQAAPVLRQIVEQRHAARRPSSFRPCGRSTAIRDAGAVPVLTKIVADASVGPDASARGDDGARRAGHRRAGWICSSTSSRTRCPASAPPRCRRWRGSIPTRSCRRWPSLDADRDWTRARGGGQRAGHAAVGAEPAASDRDAAGPGSASHSRGAQRAGLVEGDRVSSAILLDRLASRGPLGAGRPRRTHSPI